MSLSASLAELIQLLSAEVIQGLEDETISGLEFDTRKIRSGELYVALPGSSGHGHDFLDQAFEKGACLALVEDSSLLKTSAHSKRLLVVSDTLAAMTTLAAWWRDRLSLPIIGITGSVGKTTCRALTAAALQSLGQGVASERSFNNHIGVPYSLCQIDRDSPWAVLEMGMNHAGELEALSRLARPTHCVLTGIAPAHTEFFPSLQAVCDAKFEILEGLIEPACVVLNGDDRELLAGYERWQQGHPERDYQLSLFGTESINDFVIRSTQSRGFDGISFEIVSEGVGHSFSIPFLGTYNSINAAAAISVAHLLGASWEDIATSLRGAKPPAMRMNVVRLAEGKTIIDDSYNANPKAVRAALGSLQELALKGQRCGVVLGHMAELGEQSKNYHREIGEFIGQCDFKFVIGVGEFSDQYLLELPDSCEGLICSNAAEAAEQVSKRDYDILLVKGSRMVGLEAVVRTVRSAVGDREA